MQEITDIVLSFIERCTRYQKLDELIEDFSQTLAKLGFGRFMMTRLPAINERNAEPHIIAHRWSVEWLDRYRAENFFWPDPVSQFSFGHGRPFTWAEARAGSQRTRKALQIASEANSVGMVDGLGFPMSDLTAVQAVVSLSSDAAVDLPVAGVALLHLMCVYCETRAAEIAKPTFHKPLTPRERETLTWIANGKTGFETATILGISAETVTSHVANAREKLGSTNTMQTVAKALMSRQIHL